jgi:hypothetical protein
LSGQETSLSRPVPSLNIPGYTIEAVAGRGGMGTVYRAEQASPKRLVALKLLTETAASPASLAAFQREANTIARLEHPHILPVYGFGENQGRPYLVLRYLSGGSVADRLRRGPIDPPTALRWMRGVADALDFAHGRGLVHRDVKPSNVLLDQTGNPYLTDFGIAASALAAEGDQATGSAPFMSPEQGRGEAVDHRADIYSLAVTLFEMLTGQKPYNAETTLGIIVRHISDPIPSARALNDAIPPAVDELLQWGMAKQPAERPQTAGEFARLLDRAIAEPQAPLRPAGTAAPGQSPTMLVPGGGAAVPGQSPTIMVPGAGAAVPGQSPTIVVPGAGAVPAARRGVSPLILAAVALLGVCLLAALALGGGAAILAALAPQATARPTATERPTNTPAPLPSATPIGQLMVDDFSNPDSGFGTFNAEDGTKVDYEDNVLRMVVVNELDEWISPSGSVDAQNVVVDVDVTQVTGPNLNELAILCRFQPNDPDTPIVDPRYVAFAINGAGEYSIWRTRDGEVTRLVDWTAVPGLATGPGVTHHLTAGCQDNRLFFEADGITLPEITDPGPTNGDIALMAGLREAGELVVEFDNVVVTE